MKKMELLPADIPAGLRLTPLLVLLALAILFPAGARCEPAALPATLEGSFAAAVVLDPDTGEVLVAKNPRLRRQPASMLKMMTELIVLERIAEGDLLLQDTVTVSAHASRMGGSQVYLKHGEQFSVEELLAALAIHSANDAAVALAEHVAGSVEAFVDLMNLEARELGLEDSEFHSVHGLPPGWRQKPDLTSALDMAKLGRELMKYPEAVEWGSTSTAPFRDGQFTLYNPNRLVGTYRGLDGIKTGYHGQAGYCVTASAVQKGKRLISVVLGCPSDKARATETTRLLSYGFNLFTQVTLIEEGRVVLERRQPVKGGKQREVSVAYVGPLTVSVLKNRVQDVSLEARLPDKFPAPLEAGQEVGKGVAVVDGHVVGEVPIVAIEAVPTGSWLDRLFH